MITKIRCQVCDTIKEYKIPERQSKNKFYYGQIKIDMRGVKTRKYCVPCALIQKKSYKSIMRAKTNKQRIHTNTQDSEIEKELKRHIKLSEYNDRYYIGNHSREYVYYICKIYDEVSNKLNVPKATVRRVMFNLRKNGTFK